MKTDQLTQKKIERAAKPGKYGDGRNLYLNVGPNGSKSWLFIFRRNGRDGMRGLGSYPAVGLEEAREKAADYRKMLRQDILPPIYRGRFQKESLGRTFEDVAERYIRKAQSGWRNDKSEKQWRSTLKTYVYPSLGKMDVGKIDVQHVADVLAPIWVAKPDMGKKVRHRIGLILGLAAAEKLRSNELVTKAGGALDHLLPARPKQRVKKGHDSMPYEELPDFFGDLRERDGSAATALEFLILTGARTKEVRLATWGEIDLEAATWSVPGERMKMQRDHRVPLSSAAVALLRSLPRDDDAGYLFISPKDRAKPLSDASMEAVLERMDRKQGVTVHGFRSTFRTWAAERCLDVPREIAEAALAHTVGGVEGAYQRGTYFEVRRELMQRWADYAEGEAA